MSGKSNDDQILGQEPRKIGSTFPGNPGRLRNSEGSEQCAGATTPAKVLGPRRGAPMDRFPGRPPGRTPGGPPGGGGHRGFGMPVQKAKDFKGTLKRLARYLKPRTMPLFTVFTFAALSTVFSILSPKIMGKATTKLFNDLMLKMSGVPGAAVDLSLIHI